MIILIAFHYKCFVNQFTVSLNARFLSAFFRSRGTRTVSEFLRIGSGKNIAWSLLTLSRFRMTRRASNWLRMGPGTNIPHPGIVFMRSGAFDPAPYFWRVR
jgi:hypothetical protein